jgi:hypothetical protein
MLNGFSILSDTRYQIDTTLTSEMYWFVVWSCVALFSYNYTAADASACVTRDEIDRLKVGLKTHIDDEICNIITDNGMYYLIGMLYKSIKESHHNIFQIVFCHLRTEDERRRD